MEGAGQDDRAGVVLARYFAMTAVLTASALVCQDRKMKDFMKKEREKLSMAEHRGDMTVEQACVASQVVRRSVRGSLFICDSGIKPEEKSDARELGHRQGQGFDPCVDGKSPILRGGFC